MKNTDFFFFDRRRSKELRPSEFWPDRLWHIPALLQGALLGVLKGNINWFVRANPALSWGGMFDSPKSELLNRLKDENKPKSHCIPFDSALPELPMGFSFPVILKPDTGERGRLVSKIVDYEAWLAYWHKAPLGNYLVQEFVHFGFEFGVFVVREAAGDFRIHSLTWKLPLGVVGDGVSRLEELLNQHPRARRFKTFWPEIDAATRRKILGAGEWFPLHFSGNHSRGATFLDARTQLSPAMELAINELLAGLDGFDYGRLDVMVEQPEMLTVARKIKVLEINGANAEPAHVYDPASWWLRGLLEHLRFQRMMWVVACRNLDRGAKGAGLRQTWQALMTYRRWQKSIL
jgi:hypothetical protein